MQRKTQRILSAAVIGLALATGGANADSLSTQQVRFEVDNNAAMHISMAGKLRMLSQLVPAAACQAASGFDTPYAQGIMDEATAEFDSIINALEFGDPEMGINYPEERRRTLASIAVVREAWAPLHRLADSVDAHTTTDEQLTNAVAESLILLDATRALAREEIEEYTNAAQMAHAEAFLIDMAGRQRMLVQRISKNACLTMTHHATEETHDALVDTMNTFAMTLDALQNGMASVGVRPPPTPEIAAGLEQVSVHWNALQPFLSDVLEDTPVDVEFAATQFKVINELMSDMDAVVRLYSEI